MGYPSASCIAGARTSLSESLPYSASMSISPPGVPGVTAASGPYSGGYDMFRLRKNSGVAPVGATPRALTAITLPVFGLKISACVSPPQASESNIVVVAASIAQAASTALPPFWKIMAPAVAARGLPVIATQCLPWSTGLFVAADARAAAAAPAQTRRVRKVRRTARLRYFSWVSRNTPERLKNWIWFSLGDIEWPSFSATMYSTGILRARSAWTIWSDSGRGTRGSLAPAYTNNGALILSTSSIGEIVFRNAASFSRSPNSTLKISRIRPLVDWRNVVMFATPKESTPAFQMSGQRERAMSSVSPPELRSNTTMRSLSDQGCEAAQRAVVSMSLNASRRFGPLSAISKERPNPPDPRTLGSTTA